jgi:hypothetical protein
MPDAASNTPYAQGQISLPNGGQILSSDNPIVGATTPPNQTPVPVASAQQPMAASQPNPVPQNAPASPQAIPAQTKPAQTGISNPQPAPIPDFSQHPAVQKASLVSEIARTLAGNPQTVTIDATGTAQRTPAKLTGRQIALAIAMQALSGGIAGAAAKPGPGVLGRAAQEGFQQGQQNVEKQQQQQEQNAQQDYNRRLLTLKNNMQTHNNAMQIGNMDRENNQAYVDSYKDLATKLQSEYPSFIKGYPTYADLKNYNVTSENAIPYQVVPRMGQDGKQATDADGKPLWDINYMIVDPSLKAEGLFTDRDIATGKKYNLAPAFNNPHLADSPMGLRMALDYKTQMTALENMDDEIDAYYKQLNASLPNDKQLHPLDIASLTAHDTAIAPAATKFQAALVRTDNGAGGYSYTQALQTLAKSDPGAAGKMAALLGGIQNVQNFDRQNAPPRQPKNVAEAEAIKADPNAKPEETKAADALIAQNRKDQIALAGGKAGAEAQAKKAVTGSDASGISDPSLSHLATPANVGADGVNHAFLSAMSQKNPERAALIQAIGEGRNTMSKYGLSKKDGQALAEDVAAAYPSFDVNKVSEYEKALNDFAPGGKSGKNLIAANTALTHLQRSYDNVGLLTSTPGLSAVGSWLGVKGAGAYKADVNALASEIATAYKGGVPDKQEVERWYNAFTALNPNTVRNSYSEAANLLLNKVDEMHQRWQDSVPSSFVAPVQFISDPAAVSYKHVTGQDAPEELRQRKRANQPSSVAQSGSSGSSGKSGNLLQGQRPNEIPVIQNGQVIGYSLPGKSGMRSVTPFAAQ